jgi:hypothetical protein
MILMSFRDRYRDRDRTYWYYDGWHRQELPVAEGREVINEIKPVVPLLLLLLRNPGNKLPGPPA